MNTDRVTRVSGPKAHRVPGSQVEETTTRRMAWKHQRERENPKSCRGGKSHIKRWRLKKKKTTTAVSSATLAAKSNGTKPSKF